MNNHRPISRKKIQMLLIVTLLAWATQTLLHQWGYGAEALAPEPVAAEKFVPAPSRLMRGATLELRPEATVRGTEIRLKQICRWSAADAPALAQVGELVMVRFAAGTPFKTVSLDEIRQTLHDAGANLALIRFAGPMTCTVNRSDAEYNESAALDEWIAARQPAASPSPATQPAATLAAEPIAESTSTAPNSADGHSAPEADPSAQSLRDLLSSDLAVRVGLPPEQLQINFNPADQKLLNLSEPQFKFNIDGGGVHNLGSVTWDVQIVTESGSKKARITASARAWQTQVVLTRPLSCKQIVQSSDLQERRMLVDRLPDEPLLATTQIVGQQASRDLKPGAVLTARMVDPVPLVRAGQFVTITLAQGSVRVKTVARAIDGGGFGQTVKVRNEATQDLYDVIITGPQEGTVGPAPAKLASLSDQ